MENLAIARVLGDIADLLEIKGENVFRVRAYRTAAATVADCGERVAGFSPAELLELPGIGKDLAVRIREIADTGTTPYLDSLLQEFPSTILDLLRLQGVGPKTVATLYETKGIGSIEALEQAARSGELDRLRGFGPKKIQQLLKAIEERRELAGRRLLSDTVALADELLAALRTAEPAATFDMVGSARRGSETCGDLDILATNASPAIMDVFIGHRLVERVLARGETKSSVRLAKGFQADLRLVPAESRGAAMQYFTGSKAHNIAVRDRALERGLKLNEYGLYRVGDDHRVAGETEESIYAALDLDWVPPELREHRGELAAAEAHALPTLVRGQDLRGDLHMHTVETDGRDTIEHMVGAALAAGLSYVAITDHSKLLSMANGMDEARTLAHARRIRAIAERVEGITVLAGVEVDILADGSLDLSEDCLAELDIVIASVHSALSQEPAQMTDRLSRALESPVVDVLGHPTGRLLLRRTPSQFDVARVLAEAAHHGVAVEINSQPDRLDLNDVYARLAHEAGATLVVSSDAHSQTELAFTRWGVTVARRAWLTAADLLNTKPLPSLRAGLRRHRRTNA